MSENTQWLLALEALGPPQALAKPVAVYLALAPAERNVAHDCWTVREFNDAVQRHNSAWTSRVVQSIRDELARAVAESIDEAVEKVGNDRIAAVIRATSEGEVL